MKKIDRQRNKGLIERTYNREREEREKRNENETDMKNVNWKTEKWKSVELKT
jgi:hypothetical protein